ncbi:hypothetical protein M8J76_000834 [Diaphorina citri]|nr:hypothetical protein M8J76_000834 [Diaphorina citri]
METGTECPGPDTMVTTEDDDVSDKSIVSDDLKILEMTTPELELGKDHPELDYDGSVRVCVPDALEQPVVYGPLFDTPKFFGYLYFIFLRHCLLLLMYKIFSSHKKLVNVNVKRGKIFSSMKLVQFIPISYLCPNQ